MGVIREGTKKKLAKHTRRLVKEHGAEIATTLLMSLVSSAATALLERAQKDPDGRGKKAKKKLKKGKKRLARMAAQGS